MSKINKLTISNFKFFGKAETIDLGGKHLLLYGENGSGKSTLFWGLYTVLMASFKSPSDVKKYFMHRDDNDQSLVNIYAPQEYCTQQNINHNNSYIKVENDTGTTFNISILDHSLCFDTAAPSAHNSLTQESYKATDFIDYKSLFRFQQFDNVETPNLYNIFRYSVLSFISFDSVPLKGRTISNAKEMWDEYIKGPNISTTMDLRDYKKSADYIEFKFFENHFNLKFQKLLDFINANAKGVIMELGYDIDFRLEYIVPSHRIDKRKKDIYSFTDFKVNFIVSKYKGEDVNLKFAHVFFNEAKMTAIALAIRLAILERKISDVIDDNALKVLALDDIMISLDMSNRDKLIDYILKKYSDKFQILFLTHSVELFDFVKKRIDLYKSSPFLLQKTEYDDWIVQELYSGTNEEGNDIPVFAHSYMNNKEKSIAYYKASRYDVSSLFVRKYIEELIQKRLSVELVYSPEGQVYPLNTLWKQFKTTYLGEKSEDNCKIIKLFETAKDILLNPTAHYQNVSKPIYKCELEYALEVANMIEAIACNNIKIIFRKDTIMKYNDERLNIEFALKSQLALETTSGGIQLNNCQCSIRSYEYNGVVNYDISTMAENQHHRFKGSTPKFKEFVTKLLPHIAHTITVEDFYNKLIIGDGSSTIREYISLDEFKLTMDI